MSDWRKDPDDPENRLMLQPRCPECGEPAHQIASLIPEAAADEWECGDCGHTFKESGHPHPATTEEWALLTNDDWETGDDVDDEADDE